MVGWIVPPPRLPVKTREEFSAERREKVRWLIERGFLKSPKMAEAILKVPREEFVPMMYRDYAYQEVPLPIPGTSATISCPHSYPLFYEALELEWGNRFLEVGSGSGYGAALAAEMVGKEGKVVTIEIDEETHRFAQRNLTEAGYGDVLLILGDGSLGYRPEAPYDRICITAACPKIPDPLVEQLREGGRLIAPIGRPQSPQDLVLLEKLGGGNVRVKSIETVLYVALRGRYGWPV